MVEVKVVAWEGRFQLKGEDGTKDLLVEQCNNWGVEIGKFDVKSWSDSSGSQLFESG